MTVLFVAGCAESTPGAKALDATQDKLDDVRSGTLSLVLLASAADAPEGTGAGFRLEGPFAVGTEEGSLPVADLRFTRVTGPDERTTRFVSTGSQAFVVAGGDVTELTQEQLADLRVRDGESTEGLEGLTLTRWLDDPTVRARARSGRCGNGAGHRQGRRHRHPQRRHRPARPVRGQ